ncbi:hypothetical protein [Bacillus sp. E214]|nr:hypothetical protein [Bacillus sp. E214]
MNKPSFDFEACKSTLLKSCMKHDVSEEIFNRFLEIYDNHRGENPNV